jgi:hypothetical protein
LVLAAGPSRADRDDILFDSLAARWLERNGLESPPAQGWPTLLEERFLHLAVGLYDLRIPESALREPGAIRSCAGSIEALVAAQRRWLAWSLGETAPPGKKGKDDPLEKWLASWSPKTFSSRPAQGADLIELAPPEAQAALETFRTRMRNGQALGFEHPLTGVRLALFPERSEFVEFVCVAGRLDPHLTASAWNPGVSTWLEYQAQDTRFLCLEYGESSEGVVLERGEAVGARNPRALAELVAQVGTRALCLQIYDGRLDPALVSGMANALVIEVYGELDTRIDGDVRSRSSEGRSIFVPGGNPDGGFLPASSAENRWRGTKGRDHFVGVLSQVQKTSGKKAPTRPERLTRFELLSDDGSTRALAQAPFLGPGAQKPAPEVLADYLELLRCYGVAFLHWLRLAGAGAAEPSALRFGEFLQALARGASAEDVPHLLERLYGRPLSATSPDELFAKETLEGEFLAWLSKQG